MMLDAQADPGRRAWLLCIHCGDTPLYLLDSDVNWSGCSAAPAYAAGGTTPVSAVNGAPSTCSTPPDPDAYVPYDAIAARPRHRFSTR
jgi:hypothetical protein